jgi:hypothetical protein
MVVVNGRHDNAIHSTSRNQHRAINIAQSSLRGQPCPRLGVVAGSPIMASSCLVSIDVTVIRVSL